MFHSIVFIFSSFILFLPPPYQRILPAPFSDFHGFHHLRCLRAWTSQRFSIDFEPTRRLSSDFETTLRLPSDFLRPTQALLKCFRSYWTFASSSRHADGLALQLTPRSLQCALRCFRRPRSISTWHTILSDGENLEGPRRAVLDFQISRFFCVAV